MVRFQYAKKVAASRETTLRDVNPYSLARLSNDWLLMGYCHLRQDMRVFRLGRMAQVKILEEQFDRPANFRPVTCLPLSWWIYATCISSVWYPYTDGW